MDEEHPLNPRSPYAATKAGGDRLAYSYFVTYGLPIVIVRPFNNYGPRQHPEKVIPRFITQALSDEPLTIHGDGHASRDWLYVDDDAEAIEAIIAADIDALAGEVINVATGDRHLGRARSPTRCSTALGKPASLKVVTSTSGPARSTGTSARPTRPSGCSAGARARSFEEGLERTVAWYRENEAWWRAILTRDATASPRPRRGAGAARAAARGARARPLRDRRRPRPGGARLRATPTGGRSSRPRTSRRSTGSPRRERRRDHRAGHRLAGRRRRARRRAARRCRTRSTPATAALATSKSRQRERFAEAGVPQPRSQLVSTAPSTGCRSRASSRRPTGRASEGLTLVRTEAELPAAIAAALEASRSERRASSRSSSPGPR